jgi:hypothetical protein
MGPLLWSRQAPLDAQEIASGHVPDYRIGEKRSEAGELGKRDQQTRRVVKLTSLLLTSSQLLAIPAPTRKPMPRRHLHLHWRSSPQRPRNPVHTRVSWPPKLRSLTVTNWTPSLLGTRLATSGPSCVTVQSRGSSRHSPTDPSTISVSSVCLSVTNSMSC